MRNSFIPGRGPGAEGVPAKQGYRTVDPEIQLEKLREENNELETQLAAVKAERDAHMCPARFEFKNPFKRAPRTRNAWPSRVEGFSLAGRMVPIIIGIAVVGVVVCFVAMIVHSAMYGIRSGIVTNRHHKAAWTEMNVSTDSNGHTSIDTTFHPERWWVIACDEGRCTEATLTEERWNGVQVGQSICLRDCRHVATN